LYSISLFLNFLYHYTLDHLNNLLSILIIKNKVMEEIKMCNEFESKQEMQEDSEDKICCCGCVGLEEENLKTELPDEI